MVQKIIQAFHQAWVWVYVLFSPAVKLECQRFLFLHSCSCFALAPTWCSYFGPVFIPGKWGCSFLLLAWLCILNNKKIQNFYVFGVRGSFLYQLLYYYEEVSTSHVQNVYVPASVQPQWIQGNSKGRWIRHPMKKLFN